MEDDGKAAVVENGAKDTIVYTPNGDSSAAAAAKAAEADATEEQSVDSDISRVNQDCIYQSINQQPFITSNLEIMQDINMQSNGEEVSGFAKYCVVCQMLNYPVSANLVSMSLSQLLPLAMPPSPHSQAPKLSRPFYTFTSCLQWPSPPSVTVANMKQLEASQII